MAKNPLVPLGDNLGEYLKEQRENARLSVRQLSELAGVSNPYLSQIERGLKRPSAEILQQIAKGLSISAETLYVQAGLLDPQEETTGREHNTRTAIRTDPALNPRQRQTLLDIYDNFAETSSSDESVAAALEATSEAPRRIRATAATTSKPRRRTGRTARSTASNGRTTRSSKTPTTKSATSTPRTSAASSTQARRRTS